MNSSEDCQPLVGAAITGDLERVRELVAIGADLNHQDRFGWSVLHRAAANNRSKVVSYLVSAGANIEARGTDGWTPLHLACVSGSTAAVEALVAVGANVESLARNGNTTLHLALVPVATNEDPDFHDSIDLMADAIARLLSAGADPVLANDRGETPLGIAKKKGANRLIEMLEEASRDVG